MNPTTSRDPATTASAAHDDSQRLTRMLSAGLLAGPVYLVVGLAQAFSRDGFDITKHALSMLTVGAYGWIQTTNFIIAGLLIVVASLGIRRATGSKWAGRLLAIHGLGMAAAGIFTPDPALGFPPGAPEAPAAFSWHATVHYLLGSVGFACFIAACFVLARHFSRSGASGWAWFSRVTGVVFAVAFAGIGSGSTGAFTLAFIGAVVLMWVWLAAVCHRLIRKATSEHAASQPWSAR